jgi:hypothetical protein
VPSKADATHAEDAAIVRLVVSVVAAACLCLFAGGVAGVVVVHGRSSSESGASLTLAPSPAPKGGIGPLEGALVTDYLARRGDELRLATGKRAAVVSFLSYRSVGDARAAVAGTDLKRLLIALPGGPPLVAPADPAKILADNAARLTRESDEMKGLSDTSDDPPFKADYAAEARAKRAQAAAASDPRGGIVFAAVVVADVTALRTLARGQGIRLVDVGAGAGVPSGLRGLRPEEATTAGMPANRPA